MPRTRFTREELEELYRHAPRTMKGLSAADTRGEKVARALTRQTAREFEQAGRMAVTEREQVGETRRAERRRTGALEEREMVEAGLGRRLGREQEFARPLKAAETRRVGALGGLREAEAEKVRYGTEFERGLEGTLKGIIGAKRRLGEAVAGERELGLTEAEREIRLREEGETEAEAARPFAREEAPTVPTRPVGRAEPLAKRVLGFTLPGLGISSLRDWLKRDREEEEYAYPGVR